jgi:hypothetical protein
MSCGLAGLVTNQITIDGVIESPSPDTWFTAEGEHERVGSFDQLLAADDVLLGRKHDGLPAARGLRSAIPNHVDDAVDPGCDGGPNCPSPATTNVTWSSISRPAIPTTDPVSSSPSVSRACAPGQPRVRDSRRVQRMAVASPKPRRLRAARLAAGGENVESVSLFSPRRLQR